ncbi:MAG TPA: hypothetical protein VFI95_20865 [Terriglobales bacterium]|nr:hypothetical protein [Terriglobales bacterium]
MFACSMLMVALLSFPSVCSNDLSGIAKGSSSQAAPYLISKTTPEASDSKGDKDAEPRRAAKSEEIPLVFAPAPTTAGTPGLFNVETAESLPKRTLTVAAYANKFSRAPGSVTALGTGFNVAAGLTNKITVFAQFEPYRHLHIGIPSELSLRQPAGCAHNVFQAPIYCGLNPGPLHNTWHGPAAGYVADFPFAAFNNSDWGPVTLGLKANFWSETRGDPLSVSMRASFVIPTESAAAELAKFGAQAGALNYSFTLALSRTLNREIVLANNITYLVTRNPQAHGQTLLTPGDQIIFGQGFIFRAQHRLQFLSEYTGVLGQEGHGFGLIGIDTENTSQGPSDPVDGVWGLRWYFAKSAAIDVGYRYMLNLSQVHDRSGFTIKLGKSFGF